MSGRRLYHSEECAHQAKLNVQAMNRLQHGEKYNEAKRKARAGDKSQVEHDDEVVVDYTRGGGPPPSFSGIGTAPPGPPRFDIPQKRHPRPQPREQQAAISDGRVSMVRPYQPDLSGLTNMPRRDRRKVEVYMARQIAMGQLDEQLDDNDMASWDALQAHDQRQARPAWSTSAALLST